MAPSSTEPEIQRTVIAGNEGDKPCVHPCNAAVFGIRTKPRPRRAHTQFANRGRASAAASAAAPIPLSHNIVRSPSCRCA
ncbi:uncharacterized protein TRAVEDRAFT_25454 [Trametes versicolor FP-101664 SS1]|uniref:uncharacterized protein n=1 Tax=Trametes versicolor (strain FP-101664) TaxID=717944 RepID=UPI000462479E|nr:uncharacterized protein TRAVEDRAFT_25454 [Trametes versicolor FP-101664 SS1]EIW64199.1 hypothetical protein TRAVEDRAFT_25454 [Trametes versicolor FP-101664 SS1]